MEKKPRVLITRYFAGSEKTWNLLNSQCDIVYDPEVFSPMSREVLFEKMKDASGIISAGDKIDAEMIANAKKLKVIADMWRGGGIDKEACEKRKIPVLTHSRGVEWIHHAEAEHILMLMLAVGKRLKEADAYVRTGKFTAFDQANKEMLGRGLRQRTFGIIGGAQWAGPHMVKIARGFDMHCVYWCPSRNTEMDEAGSEYVSKDELLEKSDYIALMVLREYRGGYVLDREDFNKMKKSPIIVNVTHGYFINEAELVKALKDGRVGGAGLDKLEKEIIASPGLTDLPNVILTPHSDGALEQERCAVFEDLVNECLNALNQQED